LAVEALEDRRLLASGFLQGSIAGTVFNDQNGDGARSAGEAGLRGWVVYADGNDNGRLDRGEAWTVSSRNGEYRLAVSAGTHTIREVVPDGWQTTIPAQGAYSVSVARRTTVTGADFGNQQAIAAVSGIVFNDADGDGSRDAGELGQAGWRVFADANGNGALDSGEASVLTSRDGSYRLTLTPGSYTIREVSTDGWQTTTPNDAGYGVTLATGDSLTSLDFGNQEIATEPPESGAFQIDLSFSGLSAGAQAIVEQAAQRWEQVIVGDLPDVRIRGQTIDDVLIQVVGQSMDGVGNALAEAGPTAVRSRGGLPYQGTIVIDTADVAAMESSSLLLDVITHEIAHVLGFGTLWSSRGLLTGTSTSAPQYTGTQAVAEYNALFGVNASGVPVEAGGGSGTALGHWRQSVFGNELMVGYAQSGGMPLSRITVAAMADLGYQVNMAAADPYLPPAASSASVVGTWAGNSSSVAVSTSTEAEAGAIPEAVADGDSDGWAYEPATAERKSEPCRSPRTSSRSPWLDWSTAVDDIFASESDWA